MSLKVPNGGELKLMDAIRTYLNSNAYLKLFKNDKAPGDTDTTAGYTEADFPGYAGIQLASWSAAVTNADGKGELNETARTFTMTGSSPTNTIYGYYVTDGSNNLLWAERAAAPYAMDANGKTYTVVPKLTGRTEF